MVGIYESLSRKHQDIFFSSQDLALITSTYVCTSVIKQRKCYFSQMYNRKAGELAQSFLGLGLKMKSFLILLLLVVNLISVVKCCEDELETKICENVKERGKCDKKFAEKKCAKTCGFCEDDGTY